MHSSAITPDDILSQHPPEIRAIAEALRRLIHSEVAAMTERAYPGWHAVGFRHPVAGYVCGIFPTDESIKLVFEHGRLLSDPAGVLQGDGKQVRYIELRRERDIPAGAIEVLLREAIALRSR